MGHDDPKVTVFALSQQQRQQEPQQRCCRRGDGIGVGVDAGAGVGGVYPSAVSPPLPLPPWRNNPEMTLTLSSSSSSLSSSSSMLSLLQPAPSVMSLSSRWRRRRSPASAAGEAATLSCMPPQAPPPASTTTKTKRIRTTRTKRTTTTTTTTTRRLRFLSAAAAATTTTMMVSMLLISPSEGAVACETTSECELLLRPGSECVEEEGDPGKKYCTNPYSAGCLRNMLGEERFPDVRTCNYDDGPEAEAKGLCKPSPFTWYNEIRINPGNWESSIFVAWIMQIILSEILSVPTSIETELENSRGGDGTCNFYDSKNRFSYPKRTYSWEGMQKANEIVDCRLEPDEICAHVIPEIWNGQKAAWLEWQEAGAIEPVMSTDMVGQFSWFVPRFTLRNDPSLASLAGLSGESNRRKLAKRFKRPTTWATYCEEVSRTKCKEDDGVAARPPISESEDGSYFFEGQYRGHFRNTKKNDCTIFAANASGDGNSSNPSCTGHFVAPTCKWSAYTDSQIYWNDIKLESNGDLVPNRGYSWTSMIEIWRAANATRSDVIMAWYRPDFMHEVFRGSDAEFARVTLSEPTEECALARVNDEDRCSNVQLVVIGSKVGSCDYEAHVLKKALTASLERSRNEEEEALRSPAYDTVKRLRVSDLVIDRMLDEWIHRGADTYGYDPRHVVCEWVAENIEFLKSFIPMGYPRVLRVESSYQNWYHYIATLLGAVATLAIVAAAVAVFHYRHKRVMVYAQPFFVLITLSGFLLVSGGAIAYATEPSFISCVVRQWMVLLGYSLELLPVIVKIAAINKLLTSGKRMKRAALNKVKLYRTVGLITLLVSSFLSIWTIMDPPTRSETFVLSADVNDHGGNFVEVGVLCASQSDGWLIASIAWQGVLLLSAMVLGIQTRNVPQEFNESQRLAAMVYSHFFFIAMRVVMFLLTPVIQPSVCSTVMSMLLSGDTLVALGFYLLPKIRDARRPQTNYNRNTSRHRQSLFKVNDWSSSNPDDRRRWSDGSVPTLGTRRAVVEVANPGTNSAVGVRGGEDVVVMGNSISEKRAYAVVRECAARLGGNFSVEFYDEVASGTGEASSKSLPLGRVRRVSFGAAAGGGVDTVENTSGDSDGFRKRPE